MSDTMTPSQRIVADANKVNEVTDTLGRVIKYRRLGALDRARLFKAIGPDQSTNVPYVSMAMVAASATSVDGVPMPFPTSDRLVENAISRLGDEGTEAIGAALVRDHMLKTAAQAKDAGDEEGAAPAPTGAA